MFWAYIVISPQRSLPSPYTCKLHASGTKDAGFKYRMYRYYRRWLRCCKTQATRVGMGICKYLADLYIIAPLAPRAGPPSTARARAGLGPQWGWPPPGPRPGRGLSGFGQSTNFREHSKRKQQQKQSWVFWVEDKFREVLVLTPFKSNPLKPFSH